MCWCWLSKSQACKIDRYARLSWRQAWLKSHFVCMLSLLCGGFYQVCKWDMWSLFNFFFMFSNFYWVDLHNKNFGVLQIYDEASTKIGLKIGPSPCTSYGIGSARCCFLNLVYRSSWLCSLLSLEYFIKFEVVVQSLSNVLLYGICFSNPHLSTHQPNIGVLLLKKIHVTHAYLMVGGCYSTCSSSFIDQI